MGKYEPLAQFLDTRNGDSWTATFHEIEKALGFPLPKSAHEYRAWWSNQQGPGHSQKEGWQAAGWETKEVNLERGVVRFERVRNQQTPDKPTRTELDQLWRKAEDISGISDRAELEKAALTAFIQREAGRRLIEMGGTMPDAKAPPRRRFN
jgi:hypothetical protein